MRDYIFIIRFGAKDDRDAFKLGEKLRAAIGDGVLMEDKLGRYLTAGGPERAMLTRDVVARPLPDRL